MEPSHDLAIPQVRVIGRLARLLYIYRRITLPNGSLTYMLFRHFLANLKSTPRQNWLPECYSNAQTLHSLPTGFCTGAFHLSGQKYTRV